MDKVFGLPAHPLFVHVPIVLLPLSFIGLALCLTRPSWRGNLLVPTAALAIIGALGAILASKSGERLKANTFEPGGIGDHGQFGEMARNLSILFAGGMSVLALRRLSLESGWLEDNAVGRLLRTGWVGMVATWGSLLIGIGMTVLVIEAGHTGAKAVWKGRLEKPPGTLPGYRLPDGFRPSAGFKPRAGFPAPRGKGQ